MVQWPAQLQQELLEHEQGHYDITALVARDLFIHLMQLKGSNYPNAAAGQRDFVDWVNMYQSKRQKIQTAYDAETGHSQANVFVPSTNLFTPPHQKGAPQIKWEGLIASAFTTPRPSGELAPDKAPYKVELEDVLIKAGISLSDAPAFLCGAADGPKPREVLKRPDWIFAEGLAGIYYRSK
jgi:hypothetical protein